MVRIFETQYELQYSESWMGNFFGNFYPIEDFAFCSIWISANVLQMARVHRQVPVLFNHVFKGKKF